MTDVTFFMCTDCDFFGRSDDNITTKACINTTAFTVGVYDLMPFKFVKAVKPLTAAYALKLVLSYSRNGNILVYSVVVHGTWHLLCCCMVNPSVLMSRL